MRTQLVLGRGELHFDRFFDGTTMGEGERYIGNTTQFSVTRDYDEIVRERSVKGTLSTKDELVIREKVKGSLVTDNIAAENIELWLAGAVDDDQKPVGFVTEQFRVMRGRLYQLGRSVVPFGVAWVDDLTLTVSDLPVAPEIAINLFEADGRFSVKDDGPIKDGALVSVRFQWRSSPGAETIAAQPKEVVGALRFKSTNPVGRLRDFYFPCVALRPSGEVALKGDEWQQWAFDLNARRLRPGAALMYAFMRGERGFTRDELAILEEGMTFDEFVVAETELNRIINVEMPEADYGQDFQA